MAAIDFPEGVPIGYVHIQNNKSWTWSGQVWNVTGVQGPPAATYTVNGTTLTITT